MKLAAIYNVWDATELLEGSIKQIYPFVDCVIAVVQSVSNYGEYYEGGKEEVERLYDLGFVFYMVEYMPDDFETTAAGHEISKRNFGISAARKFGCTHYLLMDCDEYYDSEQFLIAKEVIEIKGYDSSACGLFTYFKKPIWQLSPVEDYYVPFICKLNENSLCGEYMFPVVTDPTRAPNKTGKFYLFKKDELMMHHYSHVRKDYERKLRNSSAKGNWKKEIGNRIAEHKNFEIGNKVSFIHNRSVIEVGNLFNINLDNQ